MILQVLDLDAEINREASDRRDLIGPANIDKQYLVGMSQKGIELSTCQFLSL